jgi:hypothetical protein
MAMKTEQRGGGRSALSSRRRADERGAILATIGVQGGVWAYKAANGSTCGRT